MTARRPLVLAAAACLLGARASPAAGAVQEGRGDERSRSSTTARPTWSPTAGATTSSSSRTRSPSAAASTSTGCAKRSRRRASSPLVTRYIMPPLAGTAKNWAAYRARFVEPVRIRAGTAFWRANQRWLAQAEEIYGVPPEIVVGIVGVESIFGRQMGNFRVIDALATLAFDFPSGRQRPQRLLQGRARELVRALQERAHRPARLARQLCRRARHGAVHAVELQQVRGRLRRRRPRRPARAAPPT